MFKLSPSILSCDFTRFGAEVAACEAAGADWIHMDVMDGHFVPNITFGPVLVEAARRATALPLDVHLMIEQPDRYLADFAKAGATILTVHVEACVHLHRTLEFIKSLGCRAGVAFNPSTPASALTEILADADLILAMTVNPGFSAQKFIPSVLPKIRQLRGMLTERGLTTDIEVDGGVSPANIAQVIQAGVTVVVAANAIFKANKPVAEAIADLRGAVG